MTKRTIKTHKKDRTGWIDIDRLENSCEDVVGGRKEGWLEMN